MTADELFVLLLVTVLVAALTVLAVRSRRRGVTTNIESREMEPDAIASKHAPVDREDVVVSPRRKRDGGRAPAHSSGAAS
jgi:hypothetical protein